MTPEASPLVPGTRVHSRKGESLFGHRRERLVDCFPLRDHEAI